MLKLNFYTVPTFSVSTDIRKISSNQNNVNLYEFFLNLNKINLLWLMCFFFLNRNYYHTFWNNHFYLSTFLVFIILLISFVTLFFFNILDTIIYNKEIYKTDFFFALLNLNLLLPYLFCANTFFSFFFFLELTSVFVFYKFISSGIFYKKSGSKLYSFNRIFPKGFLNMLFFQYWTSFFSSVSLIYVLIFLLLEFNTTEWYVLNYLVYSIKNGNYGKNYFYISLTFIMLFGFFVKLGFTPVQLYKIEVYKGLPFVSIFFYTSYFFFFFFLLFILIFYFYLSALVFSSWILTTILIIVGILYAFSLLFDVAYVKAFFAYSTIINSLAFLTMSMNLIS